MKAPTIWKSSLMSQFSSAGSQKEETCPTQDKNRPWASHMVVAVAFALFLSTLVSFLLVTTTGHHYGSEDDDGKGEDALHDLTEQTLKVPTISPPGSHTTRKAEVTTRSSPGESVSTIKPRSSSSAKTAEVTTRSSSGEGVSTIKPRSSSSAKKAEVTTRSSSGESKVQKQNTTTTKAATSPRTTKNTPTPTKKINKPVTNLSMICTVDCTRFINLPTEGLCDFIVFDSLYKCHAELEALSLTEQLADFARLAASSNQTQYGCSVDALSVLNFTDAIKKETAAAWIVKYLFRNKLYHWGVMNAHEVYLGDQQNLLRNALNALKAAAAFSKDHLEEQRIASYTFLGSYGLCEMIAKDLKEVFMPDAIVVLGHVSFGPIAVSKLIPGFRCIMLPPNLHRIPEDVRTLVPYAHTFHESCRLAECLRWRYDIVVPISVSVTLKGRLFEPKTDDESATSWAMGNYDLFKECNSEFQDHHQAPAVICNLKTTDLLKNMVWDENFQTMKSFDRAFPDGNQRLTLAFDNRLTYREKLCSAKFNLTHLKFGVAAYDVNFDSDDGSCPRNMLHGVFNRTLMIKKFSLYLNKQYDKYKHNDCLTYQ